MALHVVAIAEHLHLLHADELVELLHQLLDVRVVAEHHNGNAGDFAVLRRADGKALNVEAAPGKQAGYAGKHTRFVGNQHADGIAAQVFGIYQHIAAHLRQFRQNESIGEPGATIGATISSISSMHSMMQGSRFSTAVLNAAANASTVSTRVPLRP